MNNMRELRKKKGLTMKQLGAVVGLSESTISLYENGKHEPDIETMGKIADVLEVSVDRLLGRDDGQAKKEPLRPDGLDEGLIRDLARLSPLGMQRVKDFVSGLTASDAEAASAQRSDP